MTRTQSEAELTPEQLRQHARILRMLAEIYEQMGDKLQNPPCKTLKAKMISSSVRGLVQLSVFLGGVHKGYIQQKIKDGLEGIEAAIDTFNRAVRQEVRTADGLAGAPDTDAATEIQSHRTVGREKSKKMKRNKPEQKP